jgi:hypothetical protein
LHGARSFCQAQCRFGWHQTTPGAVEQHQTQLGFKLCYVSANGGLARLQLARSGKQAALFKYHQKRAY